MNELAKSFLLGKKFSKSVSKLSRTSYLMIRTLIKGFKGKEGRKRQITVSEVLFNNQ